MQLDILAKKLTITFIHIHHILISAYYRKHKPHALQTKHRIIIVLLFGFWELYLSFFGGVKDTIRYF